ILYNLDDHFDSRPFTRDALNEAFVALRDSESYAPFFVAPPAKEPEAAAGEAKPAEAAADPHDYMGGISLAGRDDETRKSLVRGALNSPLGNVPAEHREKIVATVLERSPDRVPASAEIKAILDELRESTKGTGLFESLKDSGSSKPLAARYRDVEGM